MLRLEHVARTRDHEQVFAITDDQHRLQFLQVFVGTPVFGQFDRCAGQLPGCGLEFLFQTFKQGKCIRRRSCKATDHILTTGGQTPHLARGSLDHGLPKAHLSVARDDDLATLAHTDDGRAMPAGEIFFCHRAAPSRVLPDYMAGSAVANNPAPLVHLQSER